MLSERGRQRLGLSRCGHVDDHRSSATFYTTNIASTPVATLVATRFTLDTAVYSPTDVTDPIASTIAATEPTAAFFTAIIAAAFATTATLAAADYADPGWRR